MSDNQDKDLALSTNKFLEQLDLDQLKYAKMRCEALIDVKQREEQVTVWRVVEHGLCHGNFLNYVEAAEFLAKKAKELDEKDEDDYERCLELACEYLPLSEIPRFVLA